MKGKEGLNWREKNREGDTPLELIGRYSCDRDKLLPDFLSAAQGNIDMQDVYAFSCRYDVPLHILFPYAKAFLEVAVKKNNARRWISKFAGAVQGADRERWYFDVMLYAIERENKNYLQAMLSVVVKEYPVEFNYKELLLKAVDQGNVDMVRCILANISCGEECLLTMHELAIQNGKDDISQALLEKYQEII